MAVSRAMHRLLRVREMEEELSRAALEKAMGELRRLEAVRKQAVERGRRGRLLVVVSAGTGEIADRIAGLEEICTAQRHVAALTPRIADAELVVSARRGEFLAKRMARRQVETLIRKAETNEAAEFGRREQREADHWFLSRAGRRGGTARSKG